ncbi:NAD(P)/FAD-dependent oxidoreductase [Micrococcaceae bacterium Sec5.1]
MLNCLVIGSGVAGLSTALSLQKAGHSATVFEAHKGHSEGVGAFLTLAVNGFDALDTLGLKEEASQLGFSTPLMSMYLGSTGRHLIDFDFGGTLPDGTTARTMTRSELYALLHEESVRRGIRIEHGRRLTAVEELPDGVTAVFDDGTSARGDLLVGADGLRSAVRPLIDPASPAPRTIPLLNTGGIIPANTAALSLKDVDLGVPPGRMKMVFGKRCFYCYMPSPDGRIWWFANPLQRSSSDPSLLGQEELRDWLTGLVAGDRTPMAALIRATEDIIKPYSTFDFPSVPRWHRGRMVLVGDAAHASSPSSGQGASMAIEDAVILGRALRGATRDDTERGSLPARFAAYEAERRPRAETVVAWGRRNSEPKVRNQFTRVFQDLAMRAIFRGLARKAADNFDWLYGHHIDWDAVSTYDAETLR